ncbi:hypothetical protein FRC06_003290 [Ceratobasidium sp. 370]|nr:hypothetical protein FRC06_003290 [Ceratobasidium sp. 370]
MRASFALLALAAVASAGSISRRQLPACAMQCMTTADTGSCDPTDNTCMCNSPAFVNSTYQCVQQTCTDPGDLEAAIAGARALCAAAGVTLTESVPAGTGSATPTESAPEETSAAETSPVETSAVPSATTPAASTSAPASVTGSASSASRTSASSRPAGTSSSVSATSSASSAPNGAAGPAGISGIVGALAAVAGIVFAL